MLMTGFCKWFIWSDNCRSYGLICRLVPSCWRKYDNASKGKSQPAGCCAAYLYSTL